MLLLGQFRGSAFSFEWSIDIMTKTAFPKQHKKSSDKKRVAGQRNLKNQPLPEKRDSIKEETKNAPYNNLSESQQEIRQMIWDVTHFGSPTVSESCHEDRDSCVRKKNFSGNQIARQKSRNSQGHSNQLDHSQSLSDDTSVPLTSNDAISFLDITDNFHEQSCLSTGQRRERVDKKESNNKLHTGYISNNDIKQIKKSKDTLKSVESKRMKEKVRNEVSYIRQVADKRYRNLIKAKDELKEKIKLLRCCYEQINEQIEDLKVNTRHAENTLIEDARAKFKLNIHAENEKFFQLD